MLSPALRAAPGQRSAGRRQQQGSALTGRRLANSPQRRGQPRRARASDHQPLLPDRANALHPPLSVSLPGHRPLRSQTSGRRARAAGRQPLLSQANAPRRARAAGRQLLRRDQASAPQPLPKAKATGRQPLGRGLANGLHLRGNVKAAGGPPPAHIQGRAPGPLDNAIATTVDGPLNRGRDAPLVQRRAGLCRARRQAKQPFLLPWNHWRPRRSQRRRLSRVRSNCPTSSLCATWLT